LYSGVIRFAKTTILRFIVEAEWIIEQNTQNRRIRYLAN